MGEFAFAKWALAPPSWITTPGPDLNAIVLSSRVRLARNLQGIPFPQNAPAPIQKKVINLVLEAAKKVPELSTSHSFLLSQLAPLEKEFLMERHLISHEHAKNPGEKGLIVATGESLAIMINEEDHIRAAAFEAGLALEKAWNSLSGVESSLSKTLPLSFDKEFGFITACPTNIGSGMRASCLMHLPALTLTNNTESLINECQRHRLILRGFYGEGTRPMGSIYQVSNTQTLGISEEETIKKVGRIIQSIAGEEKKGQKSLLQPKMKIQTEDIINRSLGTLGSARLLNLFEGMLHLSNIRLGLMLGFKTPYNLEELTNLIFLIQPAHLRLKFGEEAGQVSDDILRAEFLRQKMAD